MSVMPSPDEERAIPLGDRLAVDGGLEVQLAIIYGTEPLDVSAGGHGVMMSADTRNPGIIVFKKSNYLGHYTLPAELGEQPLSEVVKTVYFQGILEKYKK